ncbi:GlyGly-CTERM sorting domain-containing protein [Photobacterium sp. GB-1]|uniref:GlyGly-CTERM sorting domain-containing protein n=1 Tax=Photobacterium sp. GB-1 TaxID=2022111 RepID=UPI001E52468E|nr:GlyGly-CTERM sorting domain-containing protein [Photobacterium sp. GB-1]
MNKILIVSLSALLSAPTFAGMQPFSANNLPENWPNYEIQNYNAQVENGYDGPLSNILVIYDPSIKPEQLNRYLMQQTAIANKAHDINNIEYRRNIVAAIPMKLEGDNVAEVADSFSFGDFDEIRRKYGASVVSLVINSNLADRQCGVQTSYHTVSVFNEACSLPTLLAHEWGHVDRLGHEYEHTQSHFEDDNYAWRCSGKPTIMSADLNYNQFDLNEFYSDPNVTRGGEACGTVTANNAKVLLETISQVRTADWAQVPPLAKIGNVTIALDENQSSEFEKVITVTRDGDLSQAASIEVYSDAVTAVPATDYQELAKRVEFAPNETTKTVSLQLVNPAPTDAICDDGERTLKLGTRWGEKLGSSNQLDFTVKTPEDTLASCAKDKEPEPTPTPAPDNGNDGGGGGGGSTGLLSLFGLALLLFRRRN